MRGAEAWGGGEKQRGEKRGEAAEQRDRRKKKSTSPPKRSIDGLRQAWGSYDGGGAGGDDGGDGGAAAGPLRAISNSCCCCRRSSSAVTPDAFILDQPPCLPLVCNFSSSLCFAKSSCTSFWYRSSPSFSIARKMCPGVIVFFLSASHKSLASALSICTNSVHTSASSSLVSDVNRISRPPAISLTNLFTVAFGSATSSAVQPTSRTTTQSQANHGGNDNRQSAGNETVRTQQPHVRAEADVL